MLSVSFAMFLKIIVHFKSLLARNIFIWNIFYNLIQIIRHFLGFFNYVFNLILNKPYIGGYYFTQQEFLRGRHSVIKKSLDVMMNQYLIDTNKINVLEIGSYAGESTLMFCHYFKKKKIKKLNI